MGLTFVIPPWSTGPHLPTTSLTLGFVPISPADLVQEPGGLQFELAIFRRPLGVDRPGVRRDSFASTWFGVTAMDPPTLALESPVRFLASLITKRRSAWLSG